MTFRCRTTKYAFIVKTRDIYCNYAKISELSRMESHQIARAWNSTVLPLATWIAGQYNTVFREDGNAIAALQTICVCSSVGMMLSGMPDMWSVVTSRSSSGRSPLPYALLLLDNCVGLWFSYLVGDKLSITLRAIGVFLSVMYIAILLVFSASPLSLTSLVCAALAAFGALWVLLPGYAKSISQQISILGLINTGTAIAFAASPLLKLQDVIREKNASSISISMSGMLLVCATAWALYGTVLKNVWMVIPNAINSLLALLQVSLFLAFPAAGRVKRD